MKLNNQKRLAAQLLKCSKKRIKFDNDRLSDIKEAITKADIKDLINDKAIKKVHAKGVSRVRARKRLVQRKKGKQKGRGSIKGAKNARLPRKREWINKIRSQRKLLSELKEKKIIDDALYSELYLKSKGNFFRSRRHIKLYLEGRIKK
ncbi:50S ribosomal protein L19e [Candidatus Woesearchaeota archaeon]|nr:50S ribosomal protein L19e [Candidatus Woesearchaeota archaeon]